MCNARNVRQEIANIFNSTQITTGSHQKSFIVLKNIYENNDFETFASIFEELIIPILMVDYKHSHVYVDRSIAFVALFCASFNQSNKDDQFEHPFLLRVLTFLIEKQELANDIIRLRSCQLINKILEQLVGSALSENLCEEIEDAMLERIYDSKAVVRLQAITALHRLQDPYNLNDPVIVEYKCMIESDISAKVRELCIKKIAGRKDVIPIILNRIRDVDANVRLAAFERISKIPDSLSIKQKRTLLRCGQLDESDKIKNYVEASLIPSWLVHFDNDYHSLMKAVRYDATESDIKETTLLYEFVLKSLFKIKGLDVLKEAVGVNSFDKLIPHEDLNWETSAYWRILVLHVKQFPEYEDELNSILPELVHICRYIQQYYKGLPTVHQSQAFMESQFILQQLFLITKSYDLSDTAGRQILQQLICNILKEAVLTLETAEVVLRNLEALIPNTEYRSRYVSEIISDIIYPMDLEEIARKETERSDKIMSLKSLNDTLRVEQHKAINENRYADAQMFEEQMHKFRKELTDIENTEVEVEHVSKKDDIPTITRYLNIAAGLLRSPTITKWTPSLETIKTEVILDVLMHDNETVRTKALTCYALCCIIDKKSAGHGIHIFSTPIFAYQNEEECDTQTLTICIQAVTDLIRIYGTKLMAEPVESNLSESQMEEHVRVFVGGTSLTNIIQGLVDLMDDEIPQIQDTAGEALCRLVLSDRIQSSSLLSRLVLKWCNPASDDVQRLKQFIGITLEKIPMMADFEQQWPSVVLVTIKTIVCAPRNSPLADVNVENIAKFLLALAQTSNYGNQIHSDVARSMCLEIKKKPRSKVVLVYSKILTMLDVPTEKHTMKDLLVLCEDLRDGVCHRTAVNNIIKFSTKLSAMAKEMGAIIEENENSLESENEN